MNKDFARATADAATRIAALFDASVRAFDECGQMIAEAGNDGRAEAHGAPAIELPVHAHGIGGRFEVRLAETTPQSERLLREFVHLILRDISRAEAQSPGQELKNAFVLSLLRGDAVIDADSVRYGDMLGLDLLRPRAVIVVDASSYILGDKADRRGADDNGRRVRDRLHSMTVINCIARFFRLPSDAVCAYIGNGEVVVLKASTSQDLDPWAEDRGGFRGSWSNLSALKRASRALLSSLFAETASRLSIGIGRYHRGNRALALSYRDARAALRLGSSVRGEGQVHCLDELGVAALAGVGDPRTQVELAQHLLTPLDGEPELLGTLAMFFLSDCSPSRAAEALFIHRNTLSYRLDKIAALTGLDPRRFDDAVQIRLAMVLQDLFATATTASE
jgi:carbohydrate diacid regulator